MTTFQLETIEIADKASEGIAQKFKEEVQRLLSSGALDPDDHHRGILFGTALENLADCYLRGGERKTREYRNLKHF